MEKNDELITALLRGSRRAQAEALRLYGGYVAAVASVMLRDPRDAEEAAQDAFMSAFRSIRTFNPAEASFATWLRRIVYHRCIDVLRQRKIPTEELPDDLPAEAEDADLGEDVEALTDALNTLAAADRELLYLAYFDDLPHAEIAFITGSNPAAIAAKLYRLRNKLAKIINERTHRQR